MTDILFSKTDKLSNARILVTNDDGIHADGIRLLEEIAKKLSDDVWVVAPETEQSGVGHGLSLHNPLRYHQLTERKIAVRGTPTDCVLFAYEKILNRRVDLVLSGINRGCNLAEDITHSGTVAGAMEGVLCGVPAIALSLMFDMDNPQAVIHWETPLAYAADIIRDIARSGIAAGVMVNINFPDCTPEECKGIKLAHTGRRNIGKQLDERYDLKGRPYYWIHWGADAMKEAAVGSDLRAIAENYIAVTPINLDLTDYKLLETMRLSLEQNCS